MPSDKLKQILKSKTDLSDKEINLLSDSEGWKIIYTLKVSKTNYKKKENEICFTGFSISEKDELMIVAQENGLDVVMSVTKSLAYLCAGENAGPVKLQKAKQQGAIIFNKEQFLNFLNTGVIPS